MTRAGVSNLVVRPYSNDDRDRVLELLVASLGAGPGGTRSAEFFAWKHLDNPYGRSFMLVGEMDGQIAGFRSFMRWRFRCRERTLRAVRAVDTATHPDHQGRGVFSRLTLAALDELRTESSVVFNTPNDRSLPGYLRMGWTSAGKVPAAVRVKRPLRFLRGVRKVKDESGHSKLPLVEASPASTVLEHTAQVSRLLNAGDESDPQRWSTVHDAEFLRWRYGGAPLLDYRVVSEQAEGELEGAAIFRIRSRGPLVEAAVADVIVAKDDLATARRLLRRVAACAPVDHLICSFPTHTTAARAAALCGFVRTGEGPTLVVNPLAAALTPDPSTLSSWALTLGDLEVL